MASLGMTEWGRLGITEIIKKITEIEYQGEGREARGERFVRI
jgi:hypothetical protein